ncbi:hypothetical protein D9M69_455820 [compost metagenome]
MVVLQRRGGRQDQVGIASGLVDVEVDAEHELQAVQRSLQLTAVGRRQHRVAGHRDQCANLPVARGQHLLGERRHRQLAAVFRQPGNAALPAVEMPARGAGDQVHRRLGAQRPALAVEVAGDQVDQLHQPLAERAERLGRHAHAAVAHRALGGGEIARQLTDLFGRHAAAQAHGLGVERRDGGPHRLDPTGRQRRRTGQAFGKQGVQHAEQQRGVLSRTDEQVLVGNRRRLAAPRIDHHQLAAARLERLEALLHVRHGHDAAVGGQRVAAEDQHEIGVVDVRDRDQQAVAVHQVADQVVRELVHRGRRVAVAGLQLAEEIVAVGHQPVVVHTRVALVHGDRVLPVARLDVGKLLGDQGEGLVPADRLPAVADPAHRLAQAVGVALDVLQGHRLRADVAAAEAVLGIALDRQDALAAVVQAFGFEGQAADGLAQVARTVMEGLGHGLASHYCRSRRPVGSRKSDYGSSPAT